MNAFACQYRMCVFVQIRMFSTQYKHFKHHYTQNIDQTIKMHFNYEIEMQITCTILP